MGALGDNRWTIMAAILVALLLFTYEALAEQSISSSLGVIVYPAKGQSAQLQNSDEGECYAWSRQQTGIDPVAVAGTPVEQSGPAVGGGERLKGAARGGLGGAVIGEIADDDGGKGAAIGATVGTLAGGRQARKNKEAQEQQAQQSQAATLEQFNKAFGVCMEGRGYTVK